MKSCLFYLFAAFFAAALALWLSPPPTCDIGSGTDLSCARGFETRERAYGSSFRWSNEYAEIHLSGVGYGPPALVALTMRSGRPAGTAPTPAHLGINGNSLAHITVPPIDRHYRLLIRPAFPSGDVARLQIASETWKPNPLSRIFGLILVKARIEPAGMPLPGPLLVLCWLALFLAARLAIARQDVAERSGAWWGVALPLLLLPLFPFVPLLPYLPWGTLVAGTGALLWHRTAPHASRPLLWAILAALPYLLIIAMDLPGWARLPLLVAAGSLAVVGALRVGRNVTAALPFLPLLMGAALARLLLLGGRLLSGNTRLDADIELFYSYGMALREIGLPEVEYPAGALVPWALLSWISGDSREGFALLLPLLNIACDVAIVAALAWLGSARLSTTRERPARTPQSLAPAAFYAFSPLLEPFVFGKYDPLPAALAVGALALFAANRPGGAGFATGLGATIKWTPVLSLPFLAWHLLRRWQWGYFARLVVLHLAAIALFSLPFALADLPSFLSPYQVQGGRGMNGESLWALVALLFDPDMAARLEAPWGMVWSPVLPISLMVGIQGAVLGVAGLIALVRPPLLRRSLMLAALAPALFFILNRVFSPQYLLAISGALLAALALARPRPWACGLSLALLALAQCSNLLVWPFLHRQLWVGANATLFAILLALSFWLIGRAAFLPQPAYENNN